MMKLLLVALGGGLGAALRYSVFLLADRAMGHTFPWGTLSVNVAGSALMGLLAAWAFSRGDASEDLRLLLGVGVLGGFTTFSAFSLDAVRLAEQANWPAFAVYVAVSVAGSIGALGVGLAVGRTLIGGDQ